MVRKFCLSLHYYSPRAYEFVRETFKNNLPHPKTIQNWYSMSDIRGEPGIQQHHFERLKKIANDFKEEKRTEMICSLIFDEMSVRQHIYWSRSHLDYIGVVQELNQDMPAVPDDHNGVERNVIAKQTIVFYLNGINTKFEYPVAYYVIDKINSSQRKDVLLEILSAVTECGIRVSNLTFDGLYCNTKTCELLGANLDVFSKNFQPFFPNPNNDENIFIILDPCHMQKLLRNTLASKKVILYRNGKHETQIKWQHIVDLFEFSRTNGLRTHKLTKKHIEWEQNDMNVCLAVQTLSASVANSMAILKNHKNPDFIDADSTIEFIHNMNTLFDVFNTRGSTNPDIFEQALSQLNNRVVFDFFDKVANYLKCLWIEDANKNTRTKPAKPIKPKKVPILASRRKTAFRGYIINMFSLKLMFDQFIKNDGVLESLSTYYLQQDALEMFFGKIRARGGFNNNPNVDQFKGAYRRLLANLKIVSSTFGNCRPIDDKLPEDVHYSNIFFVSSNRRKTDFSDIQEIYETQKDDILKILK